MDLPPSLSLSELITCRGLLEIKRQIARTVKLQRKQPIHIIELRISHGFLEKQTYFLDNNYPAYFNINSTEVLSLCLHEATLAMNHGVAVSHYS